MPKGNRNKVTEKIGEGVINAYSAVSKAALGLNSFINSFHDALNNFMVRPIGLANPRGENYAFMRATLQRNIGGFGMSTINGFGTPRGFYADVNYNEFSQNAWFANDIIKRSYNDYLSYVNNTYYKELNDVHAAAVNGILEVKPNAEELIRTNVGYIDAINQLDTISFPQILSNSNASVSDINPNNYGGSGLDTRTGVISNYYLANTLRTSIDYQEALGYSYTHKPFTEESFSDSMMMGSLNKKNAYGGNTVIGNNKIKGSATITRGIYSKFGLEGEYGLIGSGKKSFIDNDTDSIAQGSYTKPNSYVVGDIIPWSSVDHLYDSLTIPEDRQRVANIQSSITGGNKGAVTLWFKDYVQETDLIHKYYPFGNYYSLTYSLGLVSNSGVATQNYIAYSMLGYPLSKIKTDAKTGKALDVTTLLTNDSVQGKVYAEIIDKDGIPQKIYEPYPRKYYVTNGSQGTNYLDQMTGLVHSFTKHGGDGNENIVRINIVDPGNDNLWSARAIFEHIEAEGNTPNSPLGEWDKEYKQMKVANSGISFGSYKLYDADTIGTRPDVLAKTNALFSTNKIKSIIGRFHTDIIGESASDARQNVDYISTAISKYGMSRGRNLLRANHGPNTNKKSGNGYDNPYCRVWTYHNQYKSLNETIRPFEESLVGTEVSRYRTPEKDGWPDGQTRLEKYGARHKGSKLISFAPTRDENELLKDQLKHMMFSIENLAWKGKTDFLSDDQKGPNGGRIMWFPPYNLTFNEATSVNWQDTEFIGRGEPIPTYINTKRTGTLSFDILIDHPSIINSFSGKQIGGEGIGDVDDTGSYEQQLLRFFAGCELLDKTTATVAKDTPKKEEQKVAPMVEVKETSNSEELVLGFFVFYPNNYSGVDDKDRPSIEIEGNGAKIPYPISYLLRGVGSGEETYIANEYQQKQSDTLRTAFINLDDNKTYLERHTLLRPVPPNRVDEFIEANGYEMLDGRGLNTIYRFNTVLLKPYFPKDFDNRMRAMDFSYRAFVSKSGKKQWGYRVDKAYQEENLVKNGGKNYVDNTSHCLNSTGFAEALTHYSIPQNETSKFVSFADAFVGIELNGNADIAKLSECVDTKRVEYVLNAIEKLGNAKKVIVKTSGYASIHGYKENNRALANNRRQTLENWLKNKSFLNGFVPKHEIMDAPDTKYDDVNEIVAKLGRAACVKIYIATEDVSDITTSNEPIGNTKSNINIADNFTEIAVRDAKESVGNMTEEQRLLALAAANMQINKNNPTEVLDLAKAQAVEQYERLKDYTAFVKGLKDDATYSEKRANDAESNGYQGNEHKFFEDLKRTDPLLHSKIMEKIRFFDPAFHSITPEGFQARLTFLNQCTRQGYTSAWSDNSNSIRSAANLAFGRPPILVLRIGDFYNTKIIVTSLNIDYKNSSGIQWDINDEGIGVMPIYANINMQITFLGGSELGGPIPSLQNAISFNYYANTSVYDNRAEQIEYGDGDGKYTRYKISPVNE